MYETTFEEVYSNLYGERSVLMGAKVEGLFRAQYKVLRANGHTPSEASKETVEEATKSLYLFIGQKGMEYMYNDCSTTSRCGALDWVPISARLSLSSCMRVCETARRPLSLSNSSTA